MNKVLIITGMHRSGTSLIANWLSSTGLNLGENLIGPTPGNIFGHFEDVDIVEFHEELLRYNNTNLFQGIGNKLKFSQYHIIKAKCLVKQRNKNEFWGWKQPRAALFLDLWTKVLPINTCFLFPFRDYNSVINSLYIREYNKIDQKNPSDIALIKRQYFSDYKVDILNSYLSMWIRHNNEILKLNKKSNCKSLLYIRLEEFIEQYSTVFSVIKEKWGFYNLNMIDLEKIYVPKQLSNTKENLSLDLRLKLEADKIWQKLKEAEILTLKAL